ncbi:MAG: hypothetical protein NT015_02410 [Alphaproteobacteria bacterium]|nr:hypothetical protein [Alphaproteobacteria bacterium]
MITLKLRHWRTVGVAATTLGLAACGGGETGADTGEGGEGEAGEPAPIGENGGATPATSTATPTAPDAGESGESGALAAYAGLTGDQLKAMRIQHLRGYIMAAAQVVADRGTNSGDPMEAAILVQQGLIEVYNSAPDQFADLDMTAIREAAAGTTFTRAQMMQRLRAAQENLTHAIGPLRFDDAQLVVRMIDLSTGLYQQALATGTADQTEYRHAMGAALAAQQALLLRENDLRRANLGAYSRATGELNRFVALFPSYNAPATPATYQQVLVQGSRVRLALSPYL